MINVHTFTFNPFQENTYVVYNDTGACMIVDPGCFSQSEEHTLQQFIQRKKLRVEKVLCTHCHIDHVFGLDFVSRTYGISPLIPKDEMAVLESVGRVAEMYGLDYNGSPEVAYLSGSSIDLSGELFEILSVPGHSPGHVAFYHSDSGTLLAGDVLFYRSIGRTDLPGGDHATLLRSIREVLYPLDDATKVYPGHMEQTSIGDEKRFNPFLQEL